MGDESIVNVKIGDMLLKALVPAEFPARTGDEVSVSFPTEKIYLFDRKTERAIL